ncbi:hypothetical protein [Treponema sp.]|uniref:hypothetical protein n=1 Tax=Treponema sp. TaxID=166 RepID=UPI00298D8B81|nr:hypothetical protein [Treponema sp.]MCQ2242036.1 hypothetical protein [Treponema sp.]
MSEMTASDYAVMNGNNGWQNNPFLYLVFLLFMRNWGGYGYEGFSAAATQGALTRAELTDGLNNQTLQRDITDVRDAVGNTGMLVQSTGANISDKLCCGFNTLNTNILQTGSNIGAAIAQSSFESQKCCCETNRNIDAMRYENAQNTCAITTAIREDGEKTRALMTANTIQDLRDSREAVQRELQSAQLTLANAAQTQNILGQMGRYVPYSGCGCGFSNGYGY